MSRLASKDLSGVASFLASDACKNVVVLSGAGVSCAAGIPDFRSPGGMYDSLRPELLTATAQQRALMAQDPVYVVVKDMFLANQFPYHEVRRPFILGTQEQKWKATLFHRFMEVLDKKGKLLRHFTQNIDGLDFQTGIDPKRVVACHGSVGRAACEVCEAPVDFDDYCARVRANIKDIYGVDPAAPKASKNLHCDRCGKPTLKPTTVLFGASLPRAFFEALERDLPQADLVLVAGTSLVVSPANMVAATAPRSAVRVVADREPVGRELGIDYGSSSRDDVFLQGDVDDVIAGLAAEMGLAGDLRKFEGHLPEASVASLNKVG